jgi:carbon storage regulator
MLVFTLRNGEVFHVGNEVHIQIIESKPGHVRVGIEAPREMDVDRDKVRRQKQLAAEQ